MRLFRFLIAVLAFLGFSAAAHAMPVQLDPIERGEALSENVEEYGEREVARLTEDLMEAVTERLERDGHTFVDADGAVRVAITLENAWPNRPTREQLADEPGLSIRSLSLGGASVRAELFDADGNAIGEIEYSWRTREISDSVGRSTWRDAKRTFDRFARNLAEELENQAS